MIPASALSSRSDAASAPPVSRASSITCARRLPITTDSWEALHPRRTSWPLELPVIVSWRKRVRKRSPRKGTMPTKPPRRRCDAAEGRRTAVPRAPMMVFDPSSTIDKYRYISAAGGGGIGSWCCLTPAKKRDHDADGAAIPRRPNSPASLHRSNSYSGL